MDAEMQSIKSGYPDRAPKCEGAIVRRHPSNDVEPVVFIFIKYFTLHIELHIDKIHNIM